MKKFLFSFFLISLFLIWIVPFYFVEAAVQPRPLEIRYPEIEGFKPETVETLTPEYAKYIFNFAIWTSGLIALGVLVYAGFQYLTSAGNPEKVKDAKDRIASALLGLVILFGSYLILITINPQLIQFNLGPIKPIPLKIRGGVLLCINDIKHKGYTLEYFYDINDVVIKKGLLDLVEKNCRYAATGLIDEPDFDNKTTLAFLIPDTPGQKPKNGVILYNESNFRGTGQMIYRPTARDPKTNLIISGYYIDKTRTSSAKTFVINYNPDPSWYVKLYEFKDQNEDEESAKEKPYHIFTNNIAPCYDIMNDFPCVTGSWVTGAFVENRQFKSVKIESKGKLIAIFFKTLTCKDIDAGKWNQDVEIYPLISSDSSLGDNRPIKNWSEAACGGKGWKNFPAAKSMVVLSAGMI